MSDAPRNSAEKRPKQDQDAGLGATEDQVDMERTVPQHIDKKGTKVEDLAGTGEQDSPGG